MDLKLGRVGMLFFCLLCASCAAQPAAEASDYDVRFVAQFDEKERVVWAEWQVTQQRRALMELDLNAPEAKYAEFTGDGTIRRRGDRVHWKLPRKGGTLRYRVHVDHERGRAYDARFEEDWVLVRLDDLFPPAIARTQEDEVSRSRLEIQGPKDWSFETPTGRWRGHALPVVEPQAGRRFSRPTGWMVGGKLGVRRTKIGDHQVIFAAPVGQGVRRMDMLTFANYTLPAMSELVKTMPERILVVSAGDPMWRGGLSAPNSLYLHADLPMVSENGTSTVVHEFMHIAGRWQGEDWLVEGVAEFYSLELLRRSGGMSDERFEQSVEGLRERAEKEGGQLQEPSFGPHTAKAVAVLADLHKALPDGLDEWIATLPLHAELTCAKLKRFAKSKDVQFDECGKKRT